MAHNGTCLSRVAAVALALGFGISSTTAWAATVCVNPKKTSCEATIQGGVDKAVSGETIKLASGVYFENVDITTDGITVKGGKNAILDPTFPGTCSVTVANACWVDGDCPIGEICDNVGDDDGISVEANDVELRGFTIRNGQSNSIQLEVDVTGTVIRNMRLVASDSHCIYGGGGTSAGPTTVRGNEFNACGSDCLRLMGGSWNKVEVSKNKMRQCAGAGVDIDGDDVIVEKNRLTGMDGAGIYLEGDRAEVVRNRLNLISDEGVFVEGDNALIARNRLTNISDNAVDLIGNGGTVTKNKLTNIADDYAINFEGDDGEISRNRIKSSESVGISADCHDGSDACADGIVIERNKLTDVGFDDYQGIDVFAYDGSGGVDIKRNNLRNVGNNGIEYEGQAGSGPATIERNSVRTAGRGGDECYDISGSNLADLVIDRNTARDCGGHGFDVNGTGHVLSNNRVKNVGDSGVNVDGDSVEVTANKISGAAENGVEIDSGATGTSVKNNKLKNNRLDICDEGTGSSISGNKPKSKITEETEFCANL